MHCLEVSPGSAAVRGEESHPAQELVSWLILETPSDAQQIKITGGQQWK